MTKDFSKLTDDELFAIVGRTPSTNTSQDLSKLSDEELFSMAQQSQPPSLVERISRIGIPKGGTGILPSPTTLKKAGEAALEIGPGIGELGVGAFQRGAEILGREDVSQKVGQQLTQERKELTQAQKVGRGVGQIIATTPIGVGMGVIKGGAVAGGAISALTPTEEGTLEAAAKQILQGGLTGAATGGVFKIGRGALIKARQLGREAIKRVKSGVGARTIEKLEEGTAALKAKSSDLYKQMREVKGDINKRTGTQLVKDLDNTLTESGKINKKLHGDTISVVEDIRADGESGQISLEALDQHRQNLNAVIQKNTDTISGQVNADGQKATILIDQLDTLVNKLSPQDLGEGGVEARQLLNEARKDWSIFSKFQRIANLAQKADGDPNRIKAVFQQFVVKKKNLRGFSEDEKKALKFAAQNTGGEKLLKTFGKFGFDFGSSATAGNTALPALSLATGGIGGVPIAGAAAVTGGTAARQLQKLVARGKVEDALTLIQQGGINNVPEAISKIPSRKAQKELLARLLALSTTQQLNDIQE